MLPSGVIVLDVGKTLAKLSLWDMNGRPMAQSAYPNCSVAGPAYRALDATGIERWLAAGLADFAQRATVTAIVPVAHGAAAAVVREGRLACAVPDYEEEVPPELVATYRQQRDPFAVSGSPALPNGLNLGLQLHRLESLLPGVLDGDAQILPWPQYWSWRLSGVAASEVSSLGCHSDLWQPARRCHSALARARGWAARLAPLRHAAEVLGGLSPEWVERTALGAQVRVHCGLHDSNAALLAARGFRELAGHEATVVSTGTWFVAMRSPGPGAAADLDALAEARDCLVNVDVDGRPVPSARFMGGRELETLGSFGAADEAATLAAAPSVLNAAAMVLPCWAPGVGPFPGARAGWIAEPADPAARRAALALYLALMTDAALELIGTRERVLVEGRFAECTTFVRTLAALRPDAEVYACPAYDGVPHGARRLIEPALAAPGVLRRVEPLPGDLAFYKEQWLRRIGERGNA